MPEDEGALVSAGMWDRLASAWDAHGDWHTEVTAELTRRMVDRLDPAPGQRIVEAACGPTADGAREVVRRCPDARVTATDLSPEMLAAARRRGGDALDYRVLDVANPDLADGEIDGWLARWVYMLLPDPAAAFAQARRVLGAGGRFVTAVFDEPSANPFFMMPAGVLIEAGKLQPPTPGEPSMFALADTARTTQLLEAAGFEHVEHQSVDVPYAFADGHELWRWVTEVAGPVSLTLAQLEADEVATLRAEIERRAAAFAVGEGYSLPGRALVFAAS